MAGSVNKVILIGNLGADPEIRTMSNGDRTATFNLATSESWKDKSTGEKKERTEWHRVVVFSQGIVGIAEKYLKKGHKVHVEGQLQTRKWTDSNGVERYTTEIVLKAFKGELTMLQSSGGGAPPPVDSEDAYGYGAQEPSHAPGNDFSDEIPF